MEVDKNALFNSLVRSWKSAYSEKSGKNLLMPWRINILPKSLKDGNNEGKMPSHKLRYFMPVFIYFMYSSKTKPAGGQ
jgi:hypothetical protein